MPNSSGVGRSRRELLTPVITIRRRLLLAQAPTPIQPLTRLSEKLGCPVYCKREDLTGFGFGGNKIRKLEYLLQDAVEQQADTIVTWGSNQSNWCTATATAGVSLGIEVHLVLGGGQPARLTANLKLDELVNATLHYLDTEKDADLEQASHELMQQLIREGRNPILIPVGGSTGVGTLGYVNVFGEILTYEEQHGIQFSTIVTATGSGGTQAGLVAGQTLSGWPGRIIGITTSRSSAAQIQRVQLVLGRLDAVAGTQTAGSPVIADDAYLGEGYRKRTVACQEGIEMFARTEGIFLDEVYTGKAAAGLIDYALKRQFSPGQNVLFIHTGGGVQLFE